MKRGIQSQFTWVFILIAGFVILTFFITIGTRVQAQSQERLSIELEQSLDSIISAALQSPGTTLSVPVPSAGVAFSCSATCDCTLRVGKVGSEFGEKIYFAPPLIEANDMRLWTRYWQTPFRTTNFLYIIDPATQYYFVSGSSTESLSLRDRILEVIQPQENLHFIESNEVSFVQNTGNTRFIFLRTNKDSLSPEFSDDILHGVEIVSNNIQFILKDEDLLTFELIGQPTPILNDDLPQILAAAFSSDQNMFTCGMRNSYRKLSFISQIFKERAAALDGFDNRCFYIGPAGTNPLEEIHNASTTLALNERDANAITQLQSNILNLEKRNQEHITNGCPALY